jgi:predicted DCC family thiol-disulfide oxidoreductase YuxK
MTSQMPHSSAAPQKLPVCYYNGACPVCRFEIEHYKSGPDNGRVLWIDLAAEPEALAPFGIDRAAARRRLHVLDETGRLHAGIDAFILIWHRMPRYRWLSRLVGTRPVRPVAAAVYDKLLAPLLFHWNRWRGRH